MEGAGIAMTYPFVIYVLMKLADREEDTGYENGILVKRIRLKSGASNTTT